MTYHRIWMIKCNGENCPNAQVVDNPNLDPEGWISDGTQHLCSDCREKQQEKTDEEPAT